MVDRAHDLEGIDFARLYAHRFRGIDQGARERVWEQIAPYIWERMKRPQRVLDPAAGRGEFIKAVPAASRTMVDAVEYSEVEGLSGVERIVGDALSAPLPAAAYDGVFVSNLLERRQPAGHGTTASAHARRARARWPDRGHGPELFATAPASTSTWPTTPRPSLTSPCRSTWPRPASARSAPMRVLPDSFTGFLPPLAGLDPGLPAHAARLAPLDKQFLIVARKADA